MGTPSLVEGIARLLVSEPRLPRTRRDMSLRNHDRLTYFSLIVTFTYALTSAAAG